MTEFSLPRLFAANRTKLGEILLPLRAAEAKLDEIDKNQITPLGFRFLNHFDLYDMDDKKKLSLEACAHIKLFTRRVVEHVY